MESRQPARIAVIGAGLSGLVVARRLQTLADVHVFEKSRGTGGRLATRYAGDFEFDHGAQYFTAGTEAFRAFLQPLIDAGEVAEWRGTLAEFDRCSMTTLRPWGDAHPRYVGTPRMNRVGKSLAASLTIRLDTTITAIARRREGWHVTDKGGGESGPYDWLVLTAPAPQSAALADLHPGLSEFCDGRRMLGCFALMLGFAEAINLAWQAAAVRNADISWMAVNSSKPGRGPAFSLVVHSSNAWAESHMDDDVESVIDRMLDEASLVAGRDMRLAAHRQLHRWRYANIEKQSGPACFLDPKQKLAACADWCIRGRVEAAFTSANHLAESLAGLI